MNGQALWIVFAASLPLGLVAGFIMHRSDFCLAGAFRDLFLFRERHMLRVLMLAVVVSMVLFEAARQLRLLSPYPFPILASPSVANLVGGFLFGVGMVLAGGCVVGTLYKMGAGSALSGVAFIGLIAGSGIYAEIHPWWAGLARKGSFLEGRITLPQALDMEPTWLVVSLAIFSVYFFFRWARTGQWTRRAHASGYMQPWVAGIVLAILGLASYMMVGMPFGITTAYAKAAAYAEDLVVPAHVGASSYFQAVPLKYVVPLTGTYIEGGAAPAFDAIAAIQFPVIIGIIAGSGWSAFRLGEWRPRLDLPPRQYGMALAGGILLALASRMTPGCNVWHILGGLPILALQSLFFLCGLFPGTAAGSFILRRVLNG